MKLHVKIEFDTDLDINFDADESKFKKALGALRYESGSDNLSVEICEMSKDGERCNRHISTGVHDLKESK